MKYLLLILICFLVYANCLNNAFLSDDIPAIVQNPNISKIEWLNPYNTINSLCYRISKSPFVFHLTNILLHCLATCLIFAFLKGFFKEQTSLLGASLFAVHPIHTEAVTWISGKPYIITALFALGIYFLCKRGIRNYIFALLLFTYFCISSVYQALLVGAFVILTAWVLEKVNYKKTIPFALIAIANVFIQIGVINHRVSVVAKEIGTMKWSNPIHNMAYSIFEHLRLLVYPAKLTLYHEPPVITHIMLLVEFLAMALIVLFLPYLWKRARIIFYAIALFVLCLAVTFSPVMVSWLVAERYLYLPALSMSLILCYIYEKFKERKILTYAFILIITIYGIRTVARNEDWKHHSIFWRQTIAVSPYSPQARNNLGDTYAKEGNIEQAKAEFANAIKIRGHYAQAYHNFAVMLYRQGNIKDAEMIERYALTLDPKLHNKE